MSPSSRASACAPLMALPALVAAFLPILIFGVVAVVLLDSVKT